MSRAHHEGTAIVSFQVMQETLNVLTRKLKLAMNREDLQHGQQIEGLTIENPFRP